MKLYNNPNILFPSLNEDYGFPSVFTAAGSGREEMLDIIRKQWNTINNLILLIIDIGKNGIFDGEKVEYNGKISSRIKNIFSFSNIEINKNEIVNKGNPFFKALKWFANVDKINIKQFATCSFNPDHDYLTPILSLLCSKEEGACDKIIKWLDDNKYERVYCLNQYPKCNDYMVSYIKDINNKITPVGFPYMGDHNHIGFSMEYRYTGKIPYFCTIRIQKMKEILEDFPKLSKSIQEFIIKTNKKCDNCCYCIQTDKTKTRPKAFVKTEYEGKIYLLCPYYPGFNYSFKDLTMKDSEIIIEFLELIERYCLKK